MRHPRGFTLFELVIVFTLAMVFTVTGVIGLIQLQEAFNLRSSADEIRNFFQQARELSVANMDQTTYRVTLAGTVVALETAGGSELKRFQLPSAISANPASFAWGFVPVSGTVTGCSLPCQLTLSQGSSSEVIQINSSGLIE